MNKPSNTPVAAIILVIVLGVVVVGCLVGGLFVGAGWFFYRAVPAPQDVPVIIEEPIGQPLTPSEE